MVKDETKNKCKRCDGEGLITIECYGPNGFGYGVITCRKCKGSGRVCKTHYSNYVMEANDDASN